MRGDERPDARRVEVVEAVQPGPGRQRDADGDVLVRPRRQDDLRLVLAGHVLELLDELRAAVRAVVLDHDSAVLEVVDQRLVGDRAGRRCPSAAPRRSGGLRSAGSSCRPRASGQVLMCSWPWLRTADPAPAPASPRLNRPEIGPTPARARARPAPHDGHGADSGSFARLRRRRPAAGDLLRAALIAPVFLRPPGRFCRHRSSSPRRSRARRRDCRPDRGGCCRAGRAHCTASPSIGGGSGRCARAAGGGPTRRHQIVRGQTLATKRTPSLGLEAAGQVVGDAEDAQEGRPVGPHVDVRLLVVDRQGRRLDLDLERHAGQPRAQLRTRSGAVVAASGAGGLLGRVERAAISLVRSGDVVQDQAGRLDVGRRDQQLAAEGRGRGAPGDAERRRGCAACPAAGAAQRLTPHRRR